MTDVLMALAIWLPLGTIVPFFVSKVTGADWRGALIEASIFATVGLLIYPILIALVAAIATTSPNVELIFALSYVLATITLLLFRRQTNRSHTQRSEY